VQPDRASRTAESVAARRAAHQLLDVPPVFADPIAARLLRSDLAERLRQRPKSFDRPAGMRYLRAFLAARSRYAEDRLHAAAPRGVRQYILLGAGFDTFAYRCDLPELRIIEVDHPATQAVKRRRLAAAGINEPANTNYVAADLAHTPLRDALARGGFDPTRPAVIAWLGVLPYLELPAIEGVFAFAATLQAGSEIVFDYSQPPETLGWLARFAYRRLAKRVAALGEPWKTFFLPPALHALLARHGLTVLEDLDATAINARYFARRRDHLRVRGVGRVAAAGT
jgi:methyltransferase (TIGR00027 family)